MKKSLIQAGRLRYYPASQSNISFPWRVHFSGHASICPIGLVKLRGTVHFQRPKREYPERPRPVYTVYFYQSTGSTVLGVRELCYVMLLAAADPSSYNLFSGDIRPVCFIIE